MVFKLIYVGLDSKVFLLRLESTSVFFWTWQFF